MTMVVVEGQGVRQTVGLKPASSATATIYTVPTTMGGAYLEGIHIACEGAADASVWWNNGTTDYILIPAKTLAAKDCVTYGFNQIALKPGHAVKVKDSVGNLITFTLTYTQFFKG